MKNKGFTDHEGNHYNTLKEMCDVWKITTSMYYSRFKSGMNIKEILTKKPRNIDTIYTDHKGYTYTSKSNMCKRYQITVQTFNHRINNGMSLRDALEMPVSRRSNNTYYR